MIKTRHFFVPGEPKAKGRPRAATRGGIAVVYTPNSTRDYEEYIRQCYTTQVMAEPVPAGVPLVLLMVCKYPIPQSTTAKRRDQMLQGVLMPTKRPDIDNVLKIVMDALNGLAYHDDAQIVSTTVGKRYDADPGIEIWISEAD